MIIPKANGVPDAGSIAATPRVRAALFARPALRRFRTRPGGSEAPVAVQQVSLPFAGSVSHPGPPPIEFLRPPRKKQVHSLRGLRRLRGRDQFPASRQQDYTPASWHLTCFRPAPILVPLSPEEVAMKPDSPPAVPPLP